MAYAGLYFYTGRKARFAGRRKPPSSKLLSWEAPNSNYFLPPRRRACDVGRCGAARTSLPFRLRPTRRRGPTWTCQPGQNGCCCCCCCCRCRCRCRCCRCCCCCRDGLDCLPLHGNGMMPPRWNDAADMFNHTSTMKKSKRIGGAMVDWCTSPLPPSPGLPPVLPLLRHTPCSSAHVTARRGLVRRQRRRRRRPCLVARLALREVSM